MRFFNQAKQVFCFLYAINVLLTTLFGATTTSLIEELIVESEKKSFKIESSVTLHEIYKIHDIIPFVDKTTLVLFDMDQTLIDDPNHTQYKTVPCLKPVEDEKTIQVFVTVQEKACGVMGLTARAYLGSQDKTLETLKNMSMPLTNPFPQIKGEILPNAAKTGFWDGILFTRYRSKGEFLDLFLQKLKELLNYKPEKILFVDDSEKHCLSVKECLEKYEISGNVFHYMGAFI